ncbi:MAG: hypothetical protein KDA24_08080 [Deltaproteobacteria bacterium]|nr:hypothetical protein [Deltaproteobacteria bacterium]
MGSAHPVGSERGARPRELLLAGAALFVAAWVAFAWSFGLWPMLAPPVHDSVSLVGPTSQVHALQTLPQALRADLFWVTDAVRPSPYWRPVVTLSYYLDSLWGGGAIWAFHLTNVLALVLAGLGLFAGVRRSLPTGLALGLAGLFVLHPLQAEGAVDIAGRTDLFCAAALVWLLWAEGRVAVVVLTALACGSKELGVLAPLLLLASGRGGAAASGGTVVVFLLARHWVLGQVGMGADDQPAPTAASIVGAGWRVSELLSRLVVPLGIAPAAEVKAAVGAQAAVGWSLLVATGAISALKANWRAPMLLLVGALLPVSGLVTSSVRQGDTLLVVPLLGAALLLCQGLPRTRVAGWALFGGALLAGMVGTTRAGAWTSELQLWRQALEANPDDPVLRLNLARTVVQEHPFTAGDLLLGAPAPASTRLARERASVLTRAYLGRDDPKEALHWALLGMQVGDPESRWVNGQACLLASSQAHAQAVAVCEAVLTSQPGEPALHNALGVACASRGQLACAVRSFGLAADLAPDRPAFSLNLERAELALQAASQ